MKQNIRFPRVVFCLSVIILSFMITVLPTRACSSFAVYSNRVMYGVNFDFPGNPELLFRIEQEKGSLKYFTMSFQSQGTYCRMVGMNTEGLMASLQMVPPRAGAPGTGSNGMDISAAFLQALRTAGTIEQVRKIVGGRRITPVPGFDLHCLFADRHGRAIILEIGEKGSAIVSNTGNSIVMTNFYNSDFKPGEAVSGGGADRYETLNREISARMGRFSPQAGFEMLHAARQSITQASLVFLPPEKRVQFALRGDMTKVWEVDLLLGTLASRSGFAKFHSVPLGEITGSELLGWK